MKKKYRVLSLLLAIVMIISLLPTAVFASGNDCVYISVSYDGTYVDGKNGSPIAYIPVSLQKIASVDLEKYGLSDYLYDEDGDGDYEITALHLVIYAHENIYGGSWSEVDFTGAPGSSYFQGGIFGFDENLNYYLNGEYPLAGEGWGATSDQIVLEAGDFIDLASFSSWDFYMDSNYGFHFFTDENGTITHNYTAEVGTALPVKLVRSFSAMGVEATVFDEADYTVSYGTAYGNASGTVTTDSEGCASITFPSTGTWYVWCDGGYGEEYPTAIVSAPGYATVTVTAAEEPEVPDVPEDPDEPVVPDEPDEPVVPDVPDEPKDAQDVSKVLNATMAQLASTVSEPVFGTTAGEWTVLSLARGEYYKTGANYFEDYYDRIVETVNADAASLNMNGALHKRKSTENSRLIAALSSIGKDATSVGDWDLVEAYSANGFSWIKSQGLNGTIWALIALDSNNYETSDPTIRQQCVDSILEARHDDGGWSLVTAKAQPSNVDITCMTLTALYPYRDQEAVATACAEAIEWLSSSQLASGGFPYGQGETSESCAWAIVALTMWGINPDTDARFIKDGKSAVDNLLTYYVADEAMFEHGKGAGSNAMATDQATYALVAYDRFLKGNTALYDYSDVTFEVVAPNENPTVPETPDEPDTPVTPPTTEGVGATLGLPEKVENVPGTTFNAVISVNGWDNDGAYKLLDMIVNVPEGLTVANVVVSNRLVGGTLSYNLSGGKLRIVYFDANTGSDLTVNGESFPLELLTITFTVGDVEADDNFAISVSDMNLKLTSDPTDENSNVEIDTEDATGNVTVVDGRTFSAGVLYEGDGVDLIPADKKAVVVTVTDLEGAKKLTYNDGTNVIEFKYSAEISAKLGVTAYVALVDADIAIENFENEDYFTIDEADADSITFGDINGDGVINAQDALAAVDMWLRKGDAPTDDDILSANVNGDGRIDTYDALAIVEAFVYGDRQYAVVTKATTIFD